MHRQQGRGHNGSLRGGVARDFHRHCGGIRSRALLVGEGNKSPAGTFSGVQTGLVHEGNVQGRLRQGRLPVEELRASLQREALPQPPLLPLPDEDNEGAQPRKERFQHAVPQPHPAEGNYRQGNGGAVHRGRGAVRAHSERFRARVPVQARKGGNSRYGRTSGDNRTLPVPCKRKGHRRA